MTDPHWNEMSKIKTASWSDVRAKRPVNDAVIADLARMEAEERAYASRRTIALGCRASRSPGFVARQQSHHGSSTTKA